MSWDCLIASALAYIFIMVPLELAYAEPSGSGWKWLGNVVDLIFWFDIILCFCTTYFDPESGVEIFDQRKVAFHYLKDFFFIDIICSIPGYPFNQVLIAALESDGSGSALVKLGKAPRVLKVARSAKLLKMLRVMKVGRMVEDIQVMFPKSSLLIKICSIFVGTLTFLHINACGFSIVASASKNEGAQGSWVDQVGGLASLDWKDEYLNAMYWAATTSTTVGYGDISPQNNDEKIFCILSMCVGVGVYGYVIGVMTNVATSVSHSHEVLATKMEQVSELSDLYRLPRELKLGLMTYFRNHYKETGTLDNREQRKIFEAMPYALLLRCRKFIMARHLFDLDFFNYLSPKYFPVLVELLVPVHEYGRLIIAKQDPHQHFYILLSGRTAIQQPRSKVEDYNLEGTNEDAEKVEECSKALKWMYQKHSALQNGHMDAYALQKMLNQLAEQGGKAGESHKITLAQAKKMFKEIDTDKSGTVELGEFASWYMSEKLQLSTTTYARYGHIKAILTPVCVFGIWSAFDYGPSKYNYVCEVECELYSVDADRFKQAFSHSAVAPLLERYFIGPLEKYGEEADIVMEKLKEKHKHRPHFQNEYSAAPLEKKGSKGSMLQQIWSSRGSAYIRGEDDTEDVLNSAPSAPSARSTRRNRQSIFSIVKQVIEADEEARKLDTPLSTTSTGARIPPGINAASKIPLVNTEGTRQIQLMKQLVEECEERITKHIDSQFNVILRQLQTIRDT